MMLFLATTFLVNIVFSQEQGAMPLYLKSHSYGEYVFDWAWADAYHRHGLDYYPKLLCAVPFTPAAGPRLLAPTAELRQRLLRTALELAKEVRASSLHLLFPPPEQASELESVGMMLRTGVQFHWQNPGYRDFSDFLSAMTHDKRKKIKQERRRVREAGIEFDYRLGGAFAAVLRTIGASCIFGSNMTDEVNFRVGRSR